MATEGPVVEPMKQVRSEDHLPDRNDTCPGGRASLNDHSSYSVPYLLSNMDTKDIITISDSDQHSDSAEARDECEDGEMERSSGIGAAETNLRPT